MNLLETLAGEVLSGIANVGLNLDPALQAQLSQLEGAAVRLELTQPPQALVLRVTAGTLRIQPGSEYPAQTIVRGSIPALLALLRTGTASPDLSISGDAALLEHFEALLRSFAPDFDALLPERLRVGSEDANSPFEQWLGFLEEGLASARHATTGALRQGDAALRSQIKEAFVSRDALTKLEQEADALRLAIDRLEARLALARRPPKAATDGSGP